MKARCAYLGLFLVASQLLACSSSVREQEQRYRTFYRETAQALTPDFELPDAALIGPFWAQVEGRNWETRDGTGQTKAEFWTSGEFNGDASTDYAYILAESASGTLAVFAFVSGGEGYQAIRLVDGFNWGIWLRTREPGRYATAAAGGAGPSSPDNVQEFVADYQVIDFFQPESSSSSFVWNAESQSFDRFWTSD